MAWGWERHCSDIIALPLSLLGDGLPQRGLELGVNGVNLVGNLSVGAAFLFI